MNKTRSITKISKRRKTKVQFCVIGQMPKQRATDGTDVQYWCKGEERAPVHDFHSEFMGQPQAEKL